MLNFRRTAFTMLELIMVIVVLGILASLALPRMERDTRQEAADNIISAIRYTQHMALMDNVNYNTRKTWHRRFWRFEKQGCSDNGIFYSIGSDKNRQGNIDVNRGEAAMEPSSGMIIMGQNNQPCESDIQGQFFTIPGVGQVQSSPNIFLTKKYGILEDDATMFGACSTEGANSRYIGFDYLGRPHRGFANSTKPDYSTLMPTDCNLTFTFEDGSNPLIITIEAETGRVFQAD